MRSQIKIFLFSFNGICTLCVIIIALCALTGTDNSKIILTESHKDTVFLKRIHHHKIIRNKLTRKLRMLSETEDFHILEVSKKNQSWFIKVSSSDYEKITPLKNQIELLVKIHTLRAGEQENCVAKISSQNKSVDLPTDILSESSLSFMGCTYLLSQEDYQSYLERISYFVDTEVKSEVPKIEIQENI